MKTRAALKILARYSGATVIDRLHILTRLHRPIFTAAVKFLPPKGSVLDFGCGHGLFALYASQKLPRLKITGIDISKRKIDLAQSTRPGKNIRFIHLSDSTVYLSQEKKYDAVVILNVLYLLPRRDQLKTLTAVSRSLKPNGRLIITEQDSSFALQTWLTGLRELVMVRILKLTSGATLTFNPHQWWLKVLHKRFKKIKIVNIDRSGFQKLYLCS